MSEIPTARRRHLQALYLCDLIGSVGDEVLTSLDDLIFAASRRTLVDEGITPERIKDGTIVDAGQDDSWLYDVTMYVDGVLIDFRVEVPDWEMSAYYTLYERFFTGAQAVLTCALVRPGEFAEVHEPSHCTLVDLYVLTEDRQAVWIAHGILRNIMAVTEAIMANPR